MEPNNIRHGQRTGKRERWWRRVFWFALARVYGRCLRRSRTHYPHDTACLLVGPIPRFHQLPFRPHCCTSRWPTPTLPRHCFQPPRAFESTPSSLEGRAHASRHQTIFHYSLPPLPPHSEWPYPTSAWKAARRSMPPVYGTHALSRRGACPRLRMYRLLLLWASHFSFSLLAGELCLPHTLSRGPFSFHIGGIRGRYHAQPPTSRGTRTLPRTHTNVLPPPPRRVSRTLHVYTFASSPSTS